MFFNVIVYCYPKVYVCVTVYIWGISQIGIVKYVKSFSNFHKTLVSRKGNLYLWGKLQDIKDG